LCGIFSAGLKPTGNKDPFALRRAAVGLVRILLDGEVDVRLDRVLQITAQVVNEQLAVSASDIAAVKQFVIDRLKQYLRELGFDTGMINAALDAPLGTLTDLMARLVALQAFMQTDEAPLLAAANKRIGNILRKSSPSVKSTIKEDMLIIDEEIVLFKEIKRISENLQTHVKNADYAASLSLLSRLSSPVEGFFDKVMVMDDNQEIRNNRLSLLVKLKGLFDQVANFALIN
jgi:glycyl-tRNA synthetase beta chain